MKRLRLRVSPERSEAATVGTTVRATRSEATITTQTVTPRSVMNRMKPPPVEEMKMSGTKTQIVVAVEAMMGIATSLVPRSAAVRASSPRSWTWRKIDSITTTELSTSMPRASMRPIRLMMLRVMVETPAWRIR